MGLVVTSTRSQPFMGPGLELPVSAVNRGQGRVWSEPGLGEEPGRMENAAGPWL